MMASPITLPPNTILRQVANSMNGKVNKILVTIPDITTWGSAVEMSLSAISEKSEHPLLLFRPKSREVKHELKQLARHYVAEKSLPLRIRNAQNAEQLPPPKKPSTVVKSFLKENARRTEPDRNPYTIIKACVEEKLLASISGKLCLSGLDAEDDGLTEEILCSLCLWDTGAHACSISEDLLSDAFLEYLQDPIHDPYRNSNGPAVQVDASFGFSNASISISTIFTVLPLSKIPNQRSGIILGQNAFMDHILYRSVPRAILEAKGEHVEEGVWGEIVVEEIVEAGEITSV